MKITIYELLGMIKNNKNLPKKIKYGTDIYILQENSKDYATWLNDNLDLLNDVILGHFNIEDAIYLELEILEEEKKIPGKLDQTLNFIDVEEKGYYRCIMENIFKINEIIDYLDYLKSKGE